MSVPDLPHQYERDDLSCVEAYGFGWDMDDNRELLDWEGAHQWHVWLRADVSAGAGVEMLSVEEFERDFYTPEEALTYAWQVAARFNIEVNQY